MLGKQLTIASTSKSTLLNAISCLKVDRQTTLIAKISNAKYPIFEGLNDRELCCLMSVIIGNDVCPNGV